MKPVIPFLGLTLLVSGCMTPRPLPGEPEQAVIDKLGTPTHRYRDREGSLLEYASGPYGQQTYIARIGKDGRLQTFEQVLTSEKFASIVPGKSTRQDVLHTLGAPGSTSYLPLSELEVWSYAYKEANAWDSMMHVHFDRAGIVRKMENGPDPNREPDFRLGLGLHRHH